MFKTYNIWKQELLTKIKCVKNMKQKENVSYVATMFSQDLVYRKGDGF